MTFVMHQFVHLSNLLWYLLAITVVVSVAYRPNMFDTDALHC